MKQIIMDKTHWNNSVGSNASEVMWAHNSHRKSKSCYFQVNFLIPGFQLHGLVVLIEKIKIILFLAQEYLLVPRLWTLKASFQLGQRLISCQLSYLNLTSGYMTHCSHQGNQNHTFLVMKASTSIDTLIMVPTRTSSKLSNFALSHMG